MWAVPLKKKAFHGFMDTPPQVEISANVLRHVSQNCSYVGKVSLFITGPG